MQPTPEHTSAAAQQGNAAELTARLAPLAGDSAWSRGLRRLLRRPVTGVSPPLEGARGFCSIAAGPLGPHNEHRTGATRPAVLQPPATPSPSDRLGSATIPVPPRAVAFASLAGGEQPIPTSIGGDVRVALAVATSSDPLIEFRSSPTERGDPPGTALAERQAGERSAAWPPPDYLPALQEGGTDTSATPAAEPRFLAFNGQDRRRGERRAGSAEAAVAMTAPVTMTISPGANQGAVRSLLRALDSLGAVVEKGREDTQDDLRIVFAARSAPRPEDYLPSDRAPRPAESWQMTPGERSAHATGSEGDSFGAIALAGVSSGRGEAPSEADRSPGGECAAPENGAAPGGADSPISAAVEAVAGTPRSAAPAASRAPSQTPPAPAAQSDGPLVRAMLPVRANQPGEVVSRIVIAQPFDSFRELNGFVSAVAALPDVRRATPRRFRAGTLHLAVEYSGALSLAALLRRLASFGPTVGEADDGTLTVLVEPR